MISPPAAFTYFLFQTEVYRSGHNEAVLKTVWAKAHGGSNPSASAITEEYLLIFFGTEIEIPLKLNQFVG